jgi:hypothetical protein
MNNGFVVDGISANDDAAGLAGTFFSQEVVREFQVVSSGGIAEFGRASAGTVNIVTHSGDNHWHGRLYGFLRNRTLDARNPLATRKDPLTQGQYGATASGPVVRDRTFVFSNLEQTRQNRAGFVTISPAALQSINTVLNDIAYAPPRVGTGEYATGFHSSNFFARLDHRLTDSHQLAVRYSLYDIDGINTRYIGGLNAVSRGTGLTDRDQTLAANDLMTLSSRTVNELRVQFTRSRFAAPANDAAGPAINISGVANFGMASSSPVARMLDVYELRDNISSVRGGHTFKAGVDVLYNRVNIHFPGASRGIYSFSSLANFAAGHYVTFQQGFGDAWQFQSNPNLGGFLQEEWRPRRNLTINAGLRYDIQWLPQPIRPDSNNIAPRLGVAYAPFGPKTVIRANFGIYYDRIPLRATSNALQRDGVRYHVAVLPYGQAGAPRFPEVLESFPSHLLTSVTTIDPGIDTGASLQAALQIERELNPDTSITLGYTHLRGLHILMSRNVNAPRFSAAEAARLGISNLGRPDARFANISRYESAGDSYYDAFTLSLNKRASGWSSYRMSYTFSKAIDNAGNFFFSTPQDNENIRDDRGLSANDQRHRIVLSGAAELPRSVRARALSWARGMQLSTIFTYSSPLPFNVQTGTDRNNDTNVNDRPAGIGRNTGVGFDFASLDVRLSRRFRLAEKASLDLMAEAFNVLNRTNLQFPNNIFGSGSVPLPSFGRATGASDPRQIQLGLRVSF